MNSSLETTVHRLLSEDPVWTAYALADLQPQFAPHCQWYVVDEGAKRGLILIFDALEPTVLFMTGTVDAMAQAIHQALLPARVYVTMREEHAALFAEHYTLGDNKYHMWRMFLPPEHTLEAPKNLSLRRLSVEDGALVQTLYNEGGPFTPHSFNPYQIENGVFFGITAPDQSLVAVGGTHIVDWQGGSAGLGNMYTHPQHRGRGYGGLVLQAIVATLQEKNVMNIVLNVDQRNTNARMLYERHGFEIHCPFIEGIGLKNN